MEQSVFKRVRIESLAAAVGTSGRFHQEKLIRRWPGRAVGPAFLDQRLVIQCGLETEQTQAESRSDRWPCHGAPALHPSLVKIGTTWLPN